MKRFHIHVSVDDLSGSIRFSVGVNHLGFTSACCEPNDSAT
jgi:hypothetical protein